MDVSFHWWPSRSSSSIPRFTEGGVMTMAGPSGSAAAASQNDTCAVPPDNVKEEFDEDKDDDDDVPLRVLQEEADVNQEDEEEPIGSTGSSNPPRTNTCRIFMAPASMKGNPGYGVYTLEDIAMGESFLKAPDGPSIPILDASSDTPHASERRARQHFYDTFSSYWWSRGKPDHVAFLANETADLQLTFGALPNHHCLLDSLEASYPTTSYADRPAMHSPAAGAYSYHSGRIFYASRHVSAGEEIYLNYGHCKRHRNRRREEQNEWYNLIPMPDDYKQAANIVKEQILPMFWESGQFSSSVVLEQQQHDSDSNNASEMVSRLLPVTLEQVQLINQTLYSDHDNEEDDVWLLARALAWHTAAEWRTPEWILAHGVCVEHLIPGPSAIPYAVQGAIAQHDIAQGDIIVPAPMLQVLDRQALRMYDSNDGRYMGEQLLVNYCLGHSESTMLICPMTNAALINHDSQQFNAQFVWHNNSSTELLFTMTIDEMYHSDGRGLRMDVIALRDIQRGEEVLIDYGIEWEMEWRNHLQQQQDQQPPWVGPMRYSTQELNAQDDIPHEFFSHDLRQTQSTHDYHHHHNAATASLSSLSITTACQYFVTEDEYRDDFHQPDPHWTNRTDEELLRRYGDWEDGYYDQEYAFHHDQSYWPCTIIRREEQPQQQQQDLLEIAEMQQYHNGTYLVRIHQHPHEDDTSWTEHDLPRFVRGFPRSAIHFFSTPYASDQSLPGAFRHAIGIPDEIFPVAWKNIRPQQQQGLTR